MTEVQVLRGTPTAEELAALIAVLCARPAGPALVTGYEAWRARRLAAVSVRRRPSPVR
jgi:hypothetical protein